MVELDPQSSVKSIWDLRFEQLQDDLDRISQVVNILKQMLGAALNKLQDSVAKQDLDQIRSKIDELERRISQSQESIQELHQFKHAQSKLISELESTHGEELVKMDQLRSQLMELSSRLNQLESRISSLEGMQSELQEFRSKLDN